MNDLPENELLSAYLDGELSAAEQAEVERLLATNPAARQLLDELRVALSFFNRIQVLALQVLDQRQFEHRAVIGFTHDDRHFSQAKQLSGAPAAFACDQLQMAVTLADDERLHNALFPDGISQLAQGFGRKILPWLEGARANAAQRNTLDPLAAVRCWLGSRKCG